MKVRVHSAKVPDADGIGLLLESARDRLSAVAHKQGSQKSNFRLTEFSGKSLRLPVRGELGCLPETLAEIFHPLLGPFARRAHLRLFDALFAVGAIPEVPQLLAGLGLKDGLHRLFDRHTPPVGPALRLAHQDFVRHLGDALILAHDAPLLVGTFELG
jgi:hypothetical protein